MKAIDLFSGVGGMSVGFERAGFKVQIAVEKNPQIAYGYQQNFPETDLIVGSIESIDIQKIFKKSQDNIDLVFGGPPCQGFSQKGKRQNLSDERNYLFRSFAKVVEFVRPEFFVIENVPNILTSSNGYFFDEISDLFSNFNYVLKAKILDASDYGVPQQRKRAFIVGQLGSSSFEFPIAKTYKTTVKDAISDLPVLESGEGSDYFDYSSGPFSKYQEELRLGSVGIYNHRATNHSNLAIERLKLIPFDGGDRSSLPQEHLTKSIYSGTWSRLSENGQARTITTRFDTPSSGQFTLPRQHRCLTVREAARIQSFPDKFIFTGTKSNQMLQVGNAVPPFLAFEVAKKIYAKEWQSPDFKIA